MIAPHHPSFFLFPPLLLLRRFTAIHQSVSPLASFLSSLFTLYSLPHSSRDLLLSSGRSSLIHYVQQRRGRNGAEGEWRHISKVEAIYGAEV